MRIAHIADPHLGFRAYNKITSQGLNRREADVFRAFQSALARIVELDVDLILVAGDLFHVVRPSNLTIQHAYREFAMLRQKTNAPVVILGGNHDSPRSVDTGCILDLLSNIPDVYVAHTEYVQVPLKNLDTSVFCLCHRAIPYVNSLKIVPDTASKYNVLMVHGTVEGVVRNAYDIHELQRSQVISDAWDYIAFGHYHIYEQLAPNAFYAGSLEYTSTNIWSEAMHPKGFVEYDLAERKLVGFHKVKTRDIIDLRPIDAQDVTADELNLMIQHRLEGVPGGHENKIVRLVVENLHRSIQGDLDYSVVRKFRSEALHFDLQLRPPEKSNYATSSSHSGAALTLEEEWEQFAKASEVPPGVDKGKLIELGRDYLIKQISVEQG